MLAVNQSPNRSAHVSSSSKQEELGNYASKNPKVFQRHSSWLWIRPALLAPSLHPKERGDGELTRTATLNHLIIASLIRGNEDDFRLKIRIDIFQQLHGVRTPSLFRVPEDASLRLDVLVNEARNRRAKCLLLVRADPDQKPSFGTRVSQIWRNWGSFD